MAGEESADPTNVAKHFFHEKGNVEKGFEAAHVVIEREYRTHRAPGVH